MQFAAFRRSDASHDATAAADGVEATPAPTLTLVTPIAGSAATPAITETVGPVAEGVASDDAGAQVSITYRAGAYSSASEQAAEPWPTPRGRLRRVRWRLVLLDLLAVLTAVVIVYAVRSRGNFAWSVPNLIDGAVTLLLWPAALAVERGYRPVAFARRRLVDGRLAAAASHVIALDALLVVLAPWDAEPGLTTALVASTGSALVAARALARRVMSMRRRRAADTVRVVLVADPGAMESITRRLSDAVADRVSVLPLPVSAPGSDASVRRIAATVAEHDPDVVVVDAGALHVAPLRSLLWSLEGFRAQAVVLPRLVGVADARLATTTSGGIPLLHIQPPTRDGLLVPVKGILERIVAGAALVVLAPLLGAIALVVRATSRGPALFLQTRIGQHGRPFRMVKFRSMTVDAEKHRVELLHLNDAADGLLFKIRSDPRVTRFGRILRRYSLDELPQLWNVVTGSMSLVGPRPALPSEVEAYDDTVRRRLLVKPGLTGLWQVNGRSDLSWEDAVRLDLHYVDNWSLAGDVTIVSRTVGAVLRNSGAY